MKIPFLGLWMLILVLLFHGGKAAPALASDINGANEPEFAASGSEQTTTFTYPAGTPRPSWFLVFNGSGDEITVYFKYDGSKQAIPVEVPGSITLPAGDADLVNEEWVYTIYTTCAADNVHIYPLFR